VSFWSVELQLPALTKSSLIAQKIAQKSPLPPPLWQIFAWTASASAMMYHPEGQGNYYYSL